MQPTQPIKLVSPNPITQQSIASDTNHSMTEDGSIPSMLPALEVGTEIKNMEILKSDLSFVGNDYFSNQTTLLYETTGDVNSYSIQLFDLMNPKAGELGDGHLGYLEYGDSLYAGKHLLLLDGRYKQNKYVTPWKLIPDGLYNIEFTAQPVSGNPATIQSHVGPIVIKTTTPQILGTYAEGKIKGQVIDKYIDYNAELAKHGLSYDLNEKLSAYYQIYSNENASRFIEFKLEQDGTFDFELPPINEETEMISILIVDAAGNKNEDFIFAKEEVQDPDTPVEVEKIALRPSTPIQESNSFVKSFGVNTMAISPDNDGRLDSAQLAFEFKEKPTSPVRVNIFSTLVDSNANELGYILLDTSNPQSGTAVVNAKYFNTTYNMKWDMHDGLYGMRIETSVGDDEAQAELKPFIVKSSKSLVFIDHIDYLTYDKPMLEGFVNDRFVDYKSDLEEHFGIKEFDVNDYLKASFVIQNYKYEVIDRGEFTLNQDGSFQFPLESFEYDKFYKVSINIQDIAGNETQVSEQVYSISKPEEPIVALTVNEPEVFIETGKNFSIKVTETTEISVDEKQEKDVTKIANYSIEDNSIISMEAGVITAHKAGKTKITVRFGKQTVDVNVVVFSRSLQVDQESLNVTMGEGHQMAVMEVTKEPNKADVVKNVTTLASYSVSDSSIVSVVNGLVTPKAPGKTKVTIEYQGVTSSVDITVTAPPVVSPPVTPPVTPPTTPPVVVPPTVPLPEDIIQFGDVEKHWAKKEIEALVSKGIFLGKTEELFAPEDKLTRAEFAVLVARALELEVKEYEGKFSDVSTNKKWAYAGIEAASRAGIINGKADGSFLPDAQITREEIAAIIIRAVNYSDATILNGLDTTKVFADDSSISVFAKLSVKQAVALGIVNGRSGNQFFAKANATRAEAAVMLYRALDKMNEF